MNGEQENAFWGTIDIFNKQGLLPYTMIIGSWAEYIYSYYFKTDFTPNMRTRDLDFLYRNIAKPQNKITIISELAQKGFVYREDTFTGLASSLRKIYWKLNFSLVLLGKAPQL